MLVPQVRHYGVIANGCDEPEKVHVHIRLAPINVQANREILSALDLKRPPATEPQPYLRVQSQFTVTVIG